MLLVLGVLGAFAFMIFGPFLYTWATTSWARSSDPSHNFTGQWVGLAMVADDGQPHPKPLDGVGNVAIKLQLHLKLLSASKTVVGTATVCDGTESTSYHVLGGLLGQDGHFSAFTRTRAADGSNKIGSLDGEFSPGLLVLQEGNMAAVLKKGLDGDFEQQCSALRSHGSFHANQPYPGIPER